MQSKRFSTAMRLTSHWPRAPAASLNHSAPQHPCLVKQQPRFYELHFRPARKACPAGEHPAVLEYTREANAADPKPASISAVMLTTWNSFCPKSDTSGAIAAASIAAAATGKAWAVSVCTIGSWDVPVSPWGAAADKATHCCTYAATTGASEGDGAVESGACKLLCVSHDNCIAERAIWGGENSKGQSVVCAQKQA